MDRESTIVNTIGIISGSTAGIAQEVLGSVQLDFIIGGDAHNWVELVANLAYVFMCGTLGAAGAALFNHIRKKLSNERKTP